MNTSRCTASAGRTFLFAGMALALALMLLAAPRAASAHAEVESSSPAAGTTVEAGITSISITFTEDVSVEDSTARLEGPGGEVSRVSAVIDRANRSNMTITTPPLSPGEYTVHWTAVTEDDNATENGTLNFTVAQAGAASTEVPSAGVSAIGPVVSLLASIAFALLGLDFGPIFGLLA